MTPLSRKRLTEPIQSSESIVSQLLNGAIAVNTDLLDVRIRPYRPGDVDPLYEAARESIAEMQPWLPWCHANYSREEAQAWVDENCRAADVPEAISFVIVDAEERFLGGCGLNHFKRIHRSANLGYWLRTSAHGRGVMTATVKRLRDYAFDQTDLDRLEIIVAVGNRPSLRVAERVGAVREGLLRQALLANDVRHDAVIYSLLRSDPRI